MTQYSLFKDLEKKVLGKGKACTKCGEYKPLTAFTNSSGANFKRPECKKCTAQYTRLIRDLRSTHPKPPEDYRCPICGTEEYEYGQKVKVSCWVLDHCHTTNKFRSYICTRCNLLLGYAKDNPTILAKAIQYLKGDISG